MQLQVDKKKRGRGIKISLQQGWTMIYIKTWTMSIFHSTNNNTIVNKKSFFRTFEL